MIIRSYNPVEGGPAIWLDQPIHADAQVARLLRQLREYPDADAVDVVIDCPGGNCAAGLGLYSALRDDPRRKRVTIYRAASMAGVVAMAGDEIRIAEGGTVFLHGAGYTAENILNELPGRHMAATALRHLAKRCDALDVLHISIFARRTGLEPERIAELRAADTTLDAEAAVRLGFADSIVRRQGGLSMADAYTDLAALAAKDTHGRLWLAADARVWSYAGCAIEARASNIRVPVENVPDSRVQAALADGSWVGSVVDTFANPIKLLAVQAAPAPGVAFRPLRAADLGTPAAA